MGSNRSSRGANTSRSRRACTPYEVWLDSSLRHTARTHSRPSAVLSRASTWHTRRKSRSECWPDTRCTRLPHCLFDGNRVTGNVRSHARASNGRSRSWGSKWSGIIGRLRGRAPRGCSQRPDPSDRRHSHRPTRGHTCSCSQQQSRCSCPPHAVCFAGQLAYPQPRHLGGRRAAGIPRQRRRTSSLAAVTQTGTVTSAPLRQAAQHIQLRLAGCSWPAATRCRRAPPSEAPGMYIRSG